MVFRVGPEFANVRAAAIGATLSAVLFASGCGPDSKADQNQSPTSSSQTIVDLTNSQLQAIKIGVVNANSFVETRDAVGSISYTDDPNVVQAESTLLGAAATYEVTRRELARVRSLGTANGLAQKDLEQAISDNETAEAALKAARDAVRALGITDAQIDEMIRTGKILTATNEHHETKWVIASVVESDSPIIRAGQAMEVRVTALPNKVFSGTVSQVYSSVDPNAHRITVRGLVSDPGDELVPGMLSDVSIQVGAPVQSASVPDNGVVREGDGTMTVWTTTDRRRFTQRVVDTGLRENGQVQILRGLKPGQLVVTDGAILLDTMVQAPSGDDD